MNPKREIPTAILTVSDRGSRGQRADSAAQTLRETLAGGVVAYSVVAYRIVPDEATEISAQLVAWADAGSAELILTTGGTGLSPRDRTPEATRQVLDFEVPGLAELMRAEGLKKTRKAALSRGVVGVRGRVLIVNLPGSPKGARESLEAVLELLPHALDIISSEGRRAPKAWHQ